MSALSSRAAQVFTPGDYSAPAPPLAMATPPSAALGQAVPGMGGINVWGLLALAAIVFAFEHRRVRSGKS